jgi:hypothetical protein
MHDSPSTRFSTLFNDTTLSAHTQLNSTTFAGGSESFTPGGDGLTL